MIRLICHKSHKIIKIRIRAITAYEVKHRIPQFFRTVYKRCVQDLVEQFEIEENMRKMEVLCVFLTILVVWSIRESESAGGKKKISKYLNQFEIGRILF